MMVVHVPDLSDKLDNYSHLPGNSIPYWRAVSCSPIWSSHENQSSGVAVTWERKWHVSNLGESCLDIPYKVAIAQQYNILPI